MAKIDKEVLQVLKSDGDMIVDNKARKVGSLIISDRLGGIALPARCPTPIFEQKELGRAPIQRSSVHFETVDPTPVEKDSAFIQKGAQALWESAHQGLEVEPEGIAQNRMITWIGLFASVVFLLFALWYWSENNSAKLEPPPQAVEAVNVPAEGPELTAEPGVSESQEVTIDAIHITPRETEVGGGTGNAGGGEVGGRSPANSN